MAAGPELGQTIDLLVLKLVVGRVNVGTIVGVYEL